jgi:ribose-phosphate pyrophosphokinase
MQYGKKERKFLILSPQKDKALARNISQRLNIPTTDFDIKTINGSENVVVLKSYVYQKNIFIVYNIHQPVNEEIMKLLLIVDALKREGAKHIVLIAPYLPYTKSPIDQKYIVNTNLLVRLLENIGIDSVYTFDLYSELITTVFKIPIYNVSVHRIFNKILDENFRGKDDVCIVTVDYELQKKARDMANNIKSDFIFVDSKIKNNKLEFNINKSVNNKRVLILSNTIDTGKMLVHLSRYLALKGARDIYLMVTHGIFRENAIERLEKSLIKQIYIATAPKQKLSNKIKVVSKINIITEIIQRIIERKNLKNFIK